MAILPAAGTPATSRPKQATIQLSKLVLDAGTKVRDVDFYIAAEYAQHIDDLPPIDVFTDGESWWPVDGFHRLAAHEQAKKQAIQILIHKGTLREATLFAVGANTKHGAQRTHKDKRQAVQKLLDDPEWSEFSNREIARLCRVADTLVADVRAGQVQSTAPEKTPQKRKGRDGKSYPAKRSSKPAAATPVFQCPDYPKCKSTEQDDDGACAKCKCPADAPPLVQREPDDDVESAEVLAGERFEARRISGKPIFDDRIIDKLLGQLVRALDDRAKAYCGQGPRHGACLNSLNEFKADWAAWQKAGLSK